MIPYFRILRPLNCTMAGSAVVVGAIIASETLPVTKVALAFVAAFLICGAGNTINDFFDYEMDKVNRPHRPLPSGEISLPTARYYALSMFAIGVLTAIFINVYALFLGLFNALLLYIYAWRIKRSGGLQKNLTVSYLVASPILCGGVIVGKPLVTLLLAFLAALANTGREIAKDMEDYEGDAGFADTIPARLGFKRASRLAIFFLLATIGSSPLPYLLGILDLAYLVLVLIADAVILYAAMNLAEGGAVEAGRAQRTIKIGMVLALAAFLAGGL